MRRLSTKLSEYSNSHTVGACVQHSDMYYNFEFIIMLEYKMGSLCRRDSWRVYWVPDKSCVCADILLEGLSSHDCQAFPPR